MFNVIEFFIYLLYIKFFYDFDIVLIKLNWFVDISIDYVKSICLFLVFELFFYNDFCYVVGWGNIGNIILFNDIFFSEKKYILLNVL